MKLHLPKMLLTAVLATCVAQTVQATITDANKVYTVTGGTSSDGDNAIVLPEDEDYTLIFQITGKNTDNRNFFNATKTAAGAVIIGNASGTTASDNQGLIITNGNASGKPGSSVEFTGKVTGDGIIKRIGPPSSANAITFSGDMTDYIGNIYLGADSDFTLTLGGASSAVNATKTSATKGIAGTGNIQIAKAGSKVVFNYTAATDPVYITNTISEVDTDGSTITLKGGADYIFTKNVTIDTINLEGGSISLNSNNVRPSEMRILQGTLNVGDTKNSVTLSLNRLELGDAEPTGSNSKIDISSNSTVKVTGSNNNSPDGKNYGNISLLLGEWNSKATANINGALLAKDAKALTGDAGMVINVNKGGTMAVAGIGIALRKDGKSQAITLDVKDGGKLILGSSGIEANLKSGSGITLNAGTIGMYADTTTLGAAMTLSSATGTTFDTAKYTFAADGNSISQSANATGGEMTVSGVLSGTGKLIKQGAGTLKLTASNTYSGGTEIQGGILQASNGNALGTGNVSITGGSLNVTSDSVTISQRSSGINSTIEFVTGGENQQNSSRVYSISSDAHQVNNARVEIDNSNGVTINNRLVGVDIVNKGTGTISAGNGFNNFTAIHAEQGNIILKGYGAQKQQGIVNNLSINDGLTIEAYTNWQDTLTAATIEATAFTVGEKSILKANLTLTDGATLTLNGYGSNAATINGTLSLGSDMQLNGVEQLLADLNAQAVGENGLKSLKLFNVVSVDFGDVEATLAMAADALEEEQPLIAGYDASKYFSSLDVGAYALIFQHSALYLQTTAPIPEPTTATLSLLALTALAARRRRK